MDKTTITLSPEEKLLRAIFRDRVQGIVLDMKVDGMTLDDTVSSLLSELTPRERRVLRLRFGFDGPAQTSVEVGNAFDVTRGRIWQIESKALRRLRHPTRTRRLKPYLADIEEIEHGNG